MAPFSVNPIDSRSQWPERQPEGGGKQAKHNQSKQRDPDRDATEDGEEIPPAEDESLGGQIDIEV